MTLKNREPAIPRVCVDLSKAKMDIMKFSSLRETHWYKIEKIFKYTVKTEKFSSRKSQLMRDKGGVKCELK